LPFSVDPIFAFDALIFWGTFAIWVLLRSLPRKRDGQAIPQTFPIKALSYLIALLWWTGIAMDCCSAGECRKPTSGGTELGFLSPESV
jgi:hypothetical protein